MASGSQYVVSHDELQEVLTALEMEEVEVAMKAVERLLAFAKPLPVNNRPEEIGMQAATSEDLTSVVTLYRMALNLEKDYKEVKEACKGRAAMLLNETGEVSVRTDAGTVGWTSPKPKRVLDETAWMKALDASPTLRTLVGQAEFHSTALKAAQAEYFVDQPQEPKVYIQ